MGPVVYFSFPAHGHVNPTLPVVRELVRRGARVLYYATQPFETAVRQTGAHFVPYSARLRMPERGPGPFARISSTLETLLDFSRAVLEDHLAGVHSFGAGTIAFDSFAPWGRMVAQRLRLPAIGSVPSILIDAEIDARYGSGAPPEDPRLTEEWYRGFLASSGAVLRGCGLAEPPSPPELLQSYGDWNVVYTSRLFQPMAESFDAGRFRFVGPCFDFRPEAPEFPFEWLDDRPGGRPLVLVSLGTVYGTAAFFRACLEELAGAPWQIVMATGDQPIESLGPIPENCLVRARVPQIEILRRAAAFVTHAGMNSVQEALYHGVPMAMAPQAADQFWIAARTAELGASVVLERGAPPGTIRSSVEKILSGAAYAVAAKRIGASLRAAGGAVRAAAEIEGFMGRNGAPQPRGASCPA
jgi:MGT family glycosyltransferase